MTYDEHIAALLKSHRISEMRVDHYTKARASSNYRVVHIPKVEDELTYIVALHEIGHIMTRDHRHGYLLAEAAAWHWALENSAFEIEDREAWGEAFLSLNNYLSQVQENRRYGFSRQRGTLALPKRGHWFWHIHATLFGLAFRSA